MSSFLEQPEYKRLRQKYAEARGEFAFWVGAGLSAPAGILTWTKLIDSLADEAMNSASTMNEREGKIQEAKLDELNYIDDIWEKMNRLENIMGRASFEESIDSKIGPANVAEVPKLYEEIWDLPRINHVLTLNLDTFLSRAYSTQRTGKDVSRFVGKEVGNYSHLIRNRLPFIAHLHGVIDNPSSWVLTKTQLVSLVKDAPYQNFIRTFLQGFTCIFVGISADDLAVGGFLEQLRQQGISFASHYWITARNDTKTHRWAQSNGLQVIRYQPNEVGKFHDHTTPLLEIFRDLRSYIPRTTSAPSIYERTNKKPILPSPGELLKFEPNQIRAALGECAASILTNSDGKTNVSEYVEFLDEYRRPLHLSWLVSDKSPDNRFFSYELSDKIASSAFSQVWRAYDSEGSAFAVKILNIDNLSEGKQLESFRRGIQSMRFLTDRNMKNIASLREAHEIPPSVIMDFVDGPTLRDIVGRPNFDFWIEGIKILLNVVRCLMASHSIHEEVLHRDVRPSNVIVPNYFRADMQDDTEERLEVVILNFDMSWHKFAEGSTISGQTEDFGYYAPEQLENIDGVSAQSTLVDSYMFGMLSYFVSCGQNPPRGGNSFGDWQELVRNAVPSAYKHSWKSIRRRFGRLIVSATNGNQQQRATFGTILARLEAIQNIVAERLENVDVGSWAEELLFRITERTDYSWDDEWLRGSVELKNGRNITVIADPRNNKIRLVYENTATEATRRGFSKMWHERLASAANILEGNEWRCMPETTSRGKRILLAAEIYLPVLARDFDKRSRIAREAIDLVRLD